MEGKSEAVHIISIIIGWVYFAAWSLSFYPQIWMNFKRKSVVGLSFDYAALNITGFVGYSIYNGALFFIPAIQQQYYDLYGPPLPVALNDVIFAFHAFVMTVIVIIQIFIYERGGQTVSYFCKVALAIMWFAIAVQLVMAIFGEVTWLWYIYFFSYIKLVVTLIKYIPQAYLNFKRKSTAGWSIGNILLDFTGGLLSFGQQFLDAINSGNWGVVFGSPVKVGLGVVSVFFDIIFMIQHYGLYRHSTNNIEEGYQTFNDDGSLAIVTDVEQPIMSNDDVEQMGSIASLNGVISSVGDPKPHEQE